MDRSTDILLTGAAEPSRRLEELANQKRTRAKHGGLPIYVMAAAAAAAIL